MSPSTISPSRTAFDRFLFVVEYASLAFEHQLLGADLEYAAPGGDAGHLARDLSPVTMQSDERDLTAIRWAE